MGKTRYMDLRHNAPMTRIPPLLVGPVFALIAVTLFSLNDVAMKSLSGGYALHEVVLIRSLIGMGVVLLIMIPMAGGFATIKTRRPVMHLIRAGFIVFANMSFFMGLAELDVATAVALFFISPALITISSTVFLGETVGPRRWTAVLIGLLGVLVILRPGTEAFTPAALYSIAGAAGYAGLHVMTRLMRGTESAVSMVFYIQIVFIIVGAAMWLLVGDGRFDTGANASMSFLLRAWVWPTGFDFIVMIILGFFASIGGYCISQAYRLSEAALVAPFEYLALPLGIVLGIVVFGEWPDAVVWIGIVMIMGSGLYSVWRENQINAPIRERPVRR
jgi:drug/metabolite transporter (DMT)-like permease